MDEFFSSTIPVALEKLNEDAVPEWGSMTPQHMIEHIVGSWMISNGKARSPIFTPDEKLPKYREFLFSDIPYKRNTMNPIFRNGLPPLRKPNLEAAKETLLNEMAIFFEYHNNNPGSSFNHPVFGELDYDGWLTFQKKHMGHHFTQFGLL